MELLDALAASAPEGKGEERMEETSCATDHHARREAGGRAQVFEVGLAHRLRMLCEKLLESHEREA